MSSSKPRAIPVEVPPKSQLFTAHSVSVKLDWLQTFFFATGFFLVPLFIILSKITNSNVDWGVWENKKFKKIMQLTKHI